LGVGGVRGAREGGGGAGAVVVQEARPHSMVSLRPGGRAVVSSRPEEEGEVGEPTNGEGREGRRDEATRAGRQRGVPLKPPLHAWILPSSPVILGLFDSRDATRPL
jgi:hypothetical protein